MGPDPRNQRADRRGAASGCHARTGCRRHRVGHQVRRQVADTPPPTEQELGVLRDLHARTKAAIAGSDRAGGPSMNDDLTTARPADASRSAVPLIARLPKSHGPACAVAPAGDHSADAVGDHRPVYGHSDVKPDEADLTKQHAGEPLGERIIVQGRVLDERRPPGAQHAGRNLAVQRRGPLHPRDRPARRAARSQFHRRRPRRHGRARPLPVHHRSSPAPIPGATTTMPGGPAHIHLSLFGPSFLTRLVTQMYFPGDPLFPFDPIFNSVTDAKARERMICQFDMEHDQAGMGARLPLRHRPARPRRHATRQRLRSRA